MHVIQIKVRFHAAKRPSYIIHDLIDEFIQVENRVNLLRRLLQAQKAFHLINLQQPGGGQFAAG